jgi:hypothetical protein
VDNDNEVEKAVALVMPDASQATCQRHGRCCMRSGAADTFAAFHER